MITLGQVLEYMRFLANTEKGYLYEPIPVHFENTRYEIMLKDKVWSVREEIDYKNEWENFTDESAFLTKIIKLNLDTPRLGMYLKDAIVQHGLLYFIKYKKIESFLGYEVMKDGAENMASFSKNLKNAIDRTFTRKFTLIKNEDVL